MLRKSSNSSLHPTGLQSFSVSFTLAHGLRMKMLKNRNYLKVIQTFNTHVFYPKNRVLYKVVYVTDEIFFKYHLNINHSMLSANMFKINKTTIYFFRATNAHSMFAFCRFQLLIIADITLIKSTSNHDLAVGGYVKWSFNLSYLLLSLRITYWNLNVRYTSNKHKKTMASIFYHSVKSINQPE